MLSRSAVDRRQFIGASAAVAAGAAVTAGAVAQSAQAAEKAPSAAGDKPATASTAETGDFSSIHLAGYDRPWAYTPEEVAEFTNAQHVDDQVGFQFCFVAPEDYVASILPPHFEFVAPFILGYVVEMRRPGYGAPYMESCLAVLAKYGDVVGTHNLALYLHGPGSDCGPYLFGHNCPIPKKQADDISINRIGNQVRMQVLRHGVNIWDMSLEFDGEYNDAEMGLGALGDGTNVDVPAESVGWYHPYEVLGNEQGGTDITDLKLAGLNIKNTLSKIELGKITDLKFTSTDDDPLGDIEMVKPIGAQWQVTKECIMESTDLYADLDTSVSLPSLMRYYDASLMGGAATRLDV